MPISPMSSFALSKAAPSRDEPVQFFDFSYDPGAGGIERWDWDFGDGARSRAASPMHRYAADGRYRVTLTVTTVDGRTASSSQVVQVRSLKAVR